MFRFTIRELLILTVTAGLAVGWWIDRRELGADLTLASEQSRSWESRSKHLELEIDEIGGQLADHGLHIIWFCGESGSIASVCKVER